MGYPNSTHSELNEPVDRAASPLNCSGVSTGDVVALTLPNDGQLEAGSEPEGSFVRSENIQVANVTNGHNNSPEADSASYSDLVGRIKELINCGGQMCRGMLKPILIAPSLLAGLVCWAIVHGYSSNATKRNGGNIQAFTQHYPSAAPSPSPSLGSNDIYSNAPSIILPVVILVLYCVFLKIF